MRRRRLETEPDDGIREYIRSQLLLEHHLMQLKLPSMLREYATIASVCAQDRADYPTFLLHRCERKLLKRERRAYERLSLIVTTNLPFEQWTEVCGSANG